jgi:hypothetical protein
MTLRFGGPSAYGWAWGFCVLRALCLGCGEALGEDGFAAVATALRIHEYGKDLPGAAQGGRDGQRARCT